MCQCYLLASKFGADSVATFGADNNKFGTKSVSNFGTKLVPKFGTIFDSRVPEMLVHVFQNFWQLVPENVEPKGGRWRAGLMAAIIHSGCKFWVRTTSRQLASLHN